LILIIKELVLFIVIYWFMILIHEFGHYIVLKALKTPYKFNYGFKYIGFKYTLPYEDKDYEVLIFLVAIIIGIVPLFLLAPLLSGISVNILLGLYVLGCLWDIDQIIRIIKQAK
jgi:hypothetical protein